MSRMKVVCDYKVKICRKYDCFTDFLYYLCTQNRE